MSGAYGPVDEADVEGGTIGDGSTSATAMDAHGSAGSDAKVPPSKGIGGGHKISRYGIDDLGIDEDEGIELDDDDILEVGADGMNPYGADSNYGGISDATNYGGGSMEVLDDAPSDMGVTKYSGAHNPEDIEEARAGARRQRKEKTKFQKFEQKLRSIFEGRDGKTDEMKAWSDEFLAAEDLPERTTEEMLTKYRRLIKLSTDFIEIAKSYGRTAINEYFMKSKKQQTVKKTGLGGIAGGDKYMVRGILFKLAVDPAVGKTRSSWVYGGKKPNFEFAAKAAGHELKGAINMYKYHVKGIRVPMQALVDFHGYRIIAMPLLPLKGGELIYGSRDAGKTFKRSSDDFNQKMQEIAADLHVAGHYVCDHKGKPYQLHSAGDIEGHRGSDGRYYLLDLARAFPPESPFDTPHLCWPQQAVFFRMLRPEFLQYLKDKGSPALSCDALTNWAQSHKDSSMHNKRLQAATRVLVGEVVPAFASRFAKKELKDLRDIHVSEEMHRFGINVRHAGLVRSLIVSSDAKSEEARRKLLVLMCERTLKNVLRRELRLLARYKGANPSDHESRALVVRFLNLVTRAHQTEQTYAFWDTELPFEIKDRFGPKSITIEEQNNLFGCVRRSVVDIVKYVVATTGVQLTPAAVESLERSGGPGYEFVSVDLGAMTVRIKHMSIIDYATAKVLSQEAYEDTGVGGDRLLSLAKQSFDRTLQSDPLNKICQREATITRLRIEARENEKGKRTDSWEKADCALFDACEMAYRAQDNDDVKNMVVEILGTWGKRVKHEQCPEAYVQAGGASSVKSIETLVGYVDKVDTVGRSLTIHLCSFLSTCKDRKLWFIMHQLLFKTTVKDQKSARLTLEAWTQTIKSLSGAAPEAKLVRDLVVRVEGFQQTELDVALSNFLSALEQPEFWIEACRIARALLAKHGREAFDKLYAETPWNLVRTSDGGPLTDREAKQIAQVIESESPLASLNLNGCRMKDTHIRSIARACIRLPQRTKFETLEYKQKIPVLKLRQNELKEAKYSRATSQDIVWLFSLLHHNKSVADVKIDSSNLNILEVNAIADCLKVHALKSLSITNCKLADVELKVLAPAVARVASLTRLSLSGNVFTDASGVLLGSATALTHLDLSQCSGVTDATIAAVAKNCVALEALNLGHCSQITDAGVSAIASCSGLTTLILEECSKITDNAIQALSDGCTSLEHFNIRNCKKVTGVSISQLARKCTKLQQINLCFCDYITDQAISVLASNCTQLRYLNLGHCKRLTDQSIRQIGANCSLVEELNLSVCEKITDESVVSIAKGCPQLRKLNLAVCDQITDASVSQISQSCQDLEELVVPCCDKITDNSITLLSRCKNLARLNVYACKKVTDNSISEIAKNCPNLAHLDVFWCAEVSDDVIEELKKNNPNCEVDR